MTRTQILYAWRDLAPHDDESTIDAILAMVDMITGAKSGIVGFDEIMRDLQSAAGDARAVVGYAQDAEDAIESAIDAIGKLTGGKP